MPQWSTMPGKIYPREQQIDDYILIDCYLKVLFTFVKTVININHRQVNAPVDLPCQVKFTQGNSRLMIKFSLIVI